MAANLSNTVRESYVESLIAGDRVTARLLIDNLLAAGSTAYDLLNDLVWPTMELIQGGYKDDRINISAVNLATRLNRLISDSLTSKLVRAESNGKKVLIFCGNDEPEELGGQICADLFEAAGWNVRFAGGGVPEDEVLAMIGQFHPNVTVMFGTLASGVPAVRKLIDYLREVNSCPDMQVMCCGGIYKRAEGLADEIGADLYAPDAADAVRIASASPAQRATVDQQTVGRMRRIRKAAARKAAPVKRTAPVVINSDAGSDENGDQMEAA